MQIKTPRRLKYKTFTKKYKFPFGLTITYYVGAVRTVLTVEVEVPANMCLSDCANRMYVDPRMLILNTQI